MQLKNILRAARRIGQPKEPPASSPGDSLCRELFVVIPIPINRRSLAQGVKEAAKAFANLMFKKKSAIVVNQTDANVANQTDANVTNQTDANVANQTEDHLLPIFFAVETKSALFIRLHDVSAPLQRTIIDHGIMPNYQLDTHLGSGLVFETLFIPGPGTAKLTKKRHECRSYRALNGGPPPRHINSLPYDIVAILSPSALSASKTKRYWRKALSKGERGFFVLYLETDDNVVPGPTEVSPAQL